MRGDKRRPDGSLPILAVLSPEEVEMLRRFQQATGIKVNGRALVEALRIASRTRRVVGPVRQYPQVQIGGGALPVQHGIGY